RKSGCADAGLRNQTMSDISIISDPDNWLTERFMFEISLSHFAMALGIVLAIPAILGLTSPDKFKTAMREFPRSNAWGWLFMVLGTVWFVHNVNQEQVA